MTTTATGPHPGHGWTLLVPVKALAHAKSRLTPTLDPSARRALVLAMAADVLDTCVSTDGVAAVRVVTGDDEVAALAHRRGLGVVPEPPARPDADPLNAALSAALAGATGRVGVVAADLPELRPRHLGAILAAAAPHVHSVVPDHRGAGTTMAFWTGPADGRVPRFGTDSATRHLLEGGAVALPGADPTGAAGRDVDTPGDLARLSAADVGAATAAVLGAVAGSLPPHAGSVSATMVP